MIVLRFTARCRPERLEEAERAFRDVVAPSREVEGVIGFDVAQDLTDPARVIATEVFEDEAALERQESLPEVARVMELMPEILSEPPEATVFHVSSSEAAI